jgi:hypothetical protein
MSTLDNCDDDYSDEKSVDEKNEYDSRYDLIGNELLPIGPKDQDEEEEENDDDNQDVYYVEHRGALYKIIDPDDTITRKGIPLVVESVTMKHEMFQKQTQKNWAGYMMKNVYVITIDGMQWLLAAVVAVTDEVKRSRTELKSLQCKLAEWFGEKYYAVITDKYKGDVLDAKMNKYTMMFGNLSKAPLNPKDFPNHFKISKKRVAGRGVKRSNAYVETSAKSEYMAEIDGQATIPKVICMGSVSNTETFEKNGKIWLVKFP